MENNQNLQINKSQNEPITLTLQNSLDLSRNIVAGNVNVSFLEMGLSLEDTFKKPIIRSVFKGETAQIGFSVVRVLVSRFMESFGFSTKLNDSQIDTITVDTLEKFSYESLEDIILFFKMARNGSFGATNRGVDSNLIYGQWYPVYLTLKAEARENEYSKIKAVSSRMQATDEDVAITYSRIKKNLTKKEREIKIRAFADKITEYADRQMLEDLITDWNNCEKKKPWAYILKEKRKQIK